MSVEESHEGDGDSAKSGGVRRPMNAFLIFCKRHRSLVREKNPQLDNRSVTRILGDLWANLPVDEKSTYINLAKEYKEAFLKANPDYKWYNPDKHNTDKGGGAKPSTRPTNAYTVYHGQRPQMIEGSITPGKLADPSDMGGLSLLLMAGQQSLGPQSAAGEYPLPAQRNVHQASVPTEASHQKDATSVKKMKIEEDTKKNSLFQLAEMCSTQRVQTGTAQLPPPRTAQPDPAHVKQELATAEARHTDLQPPPDKPTTATERKSQDQITMATIAWKENRENETADVTKTTVKYTELKIPTLPWSKGSGGAQPGGKTATTGGPQAAAPGGGGKVTASPGKMKGRTSTLLSPAGAGLSKMVVDKVIETVYSSGLVHADPPGMRNKMPTQAGTVPGVEQRGAPLAGPKTEPGAGKVPYTFGEIQETLIRKAVEDSYGLMQQEPAVRPVSSKSGAAGVQRELAAADMSRGGGQPVKTERGPVTEVQTVPSDSGDTKTISACRPNADPIYAMSVQPKEETQTYSDGPGKVDTNGNIHGSVKSGHAPQSSLSPRHSTSPGSSPGAPVELQPAASTAHPKKKRKIKPGDGGSAVEMGPPPAAAKPKKKRAKKAKPAGEPGREGAAATTSPSGSVIKAKRKRKKKNTAEAAAVEVERNSSGSSDPEAAGEGDPLPGEGEDAAGADSDSDESGVRKSKRSNRGQRYKQLISQGIINPIRKKSESSEDCKEDQLPFPLPRRSRKRTVSESSLGSQDSCKRYKTGDFDLEAHIASLPAVSLDGPAGKKAKPKGRTRHLSSQSNNSDKQSVTSTASETTKSQLERLSNSVGASNNSETGQELNIAELRVIRRTTSLTETHRPQQLTGSQKRKARKSSITRLHLLPKEDKQPHSNSSDGDGDDTAIAPATQNPLTAPSVGNGSIRLEGVSREPEVNSNLISTCINLKALADMATGETQSMGTEEQLSSSRAQPIAVTCT